jgi:hypothetical protein
LGFFFSRFQHHFYAVIFFILENIISPGGVTEGQPVCNDIVERHFATSYNFKKLIYVFLHVSLAPSQVKTLFKHLGGKERR